MSDSYSYIDPQNTYTDPVTGLLRNLQDITDPEVLLFVETGAVTKRLQELYYNPITIIGIESIFEIHRFLFQDIYSWAGRKRNVEISKDGKQFFPTSHFDKALLHINYLISEYRSTPTDDVKKIARQLAEILDTINYLHPFREGNGRAQREFMRTLALEKNLTLNLNPPENLDVYRRYMKGTIESDIPTLTELIESLITQ